MKNNLINRREELKLTQKDVAKCCEILTQAYQRYEYGTCIPSVEIALKIAQALDTTVEKLFILDEN